MSDIIIPVLVPDEPDPEERANTQEFTPPEPTTWAIVRYEKKTDTPPANGKPKKQLTPEMEKNKWKKGGPSPNPTGRPKKLPFTDRIAAFAETPLPKEVAKKLGLRRGATWADGLVLRQFREALAQGSTVAFRELRESIEGVTPRRPDIDPGGDGNKEIVIRIVYDSSTPAEDQDTKTLDKT